MSILEVIKTRRTTYQFLAREVELDQVNRWIEAATWAPNHKLTQPWRFWVLGDETQLALAKVFSHHRGLKKGQPGTEEYDQGVEAGLARLWRFLRLFSRPSGVR